MLSSLGKKKSIKKKKKKKGRRKHKAQMALGTQGLLVSQLLCCMYELQFKKAKTAGSDSVVQISGATFTPSGRNTLMSTGADFVGLVPCFYLLTLPTPRLGTKLVCCLHPSPWATGTASIFGGRFPTCWWADGYIQCRSYKGALSISHGLVIWFLCFAFNDLFLLHLRNRHCSLTLSVVCHLNLFHLL